MNQLGAVLAPMEQIIDADRQYFKAVDLPQNTR